MIEDETTPASTSTLAPLPTVTTTTLAPTTTVAPTVAAAGPSTTLADQPVGEWDGARFDFGRITGDGVTDDGIYRTIELDRFSYRHPTLGLVDAAGFTEEPLPVWWREPPWENNNPAVRELVLAPNALLETLAPDGEDVACAEPPPPEVPSPVWVGVDPSYVDTRAARNSVAVITFAPNGAITRIRFTHGCP